MAVVKLGWGLDQGGLMRHIREVANGAGCGCRCPDCGKPLIARQGEVMAWHFAHAVPVECFGESVLHRAAKQILLAAAADNEALTLPPAAGTAYASDLLKERHEHPWQLGTSQFQMTAARDEVKLASDWIADVVVEGQQDKPLAVEIFVRHKKDELDEEKFRRHQHDAIEIDLSGLPWDVSAYEIRRAVLLDVPRRHLYSAAVERAKGAARDQARELAQKANARYQGRLDTLKDRLTSELPATDLEPISAVARGTNAFGQEVSAPAQAQLRLTSVDPAWERLPCGSWSTFGVVNGKSRVTVRARISREVTLPPPSVTPVLVVDFVPGTADQPDGFTTRWSRTERWRDAIKARAEEGLKRLLAHSDNYKANADKLVEMFHGLSDRERLAWSAGKLGLAPPDWTGKLAPAWNASWATWKTLVYYYRVVKKAGGVVQTSQIAEDPWFERLLGWPTDEDSAETRAKQLWFWFRDLEQLGLVTHDGRQWFNVAPSLPQEFCPWQRIEAPNRSHAFMLRPGFPQPSSCPTFR